MVVTVTIKALIYIGAVSSCWDHFYGANGRNERDLVRRVYLRSRGGRRSSSKGRDDGTGGEPCSYTTDDVTLFKADFVVYTIHRPE